LNGGFNKWWVFCLTELAIFSAWVVIWTVASRLYVRRYSREWRTGGRLWFLRTVSFLGCLVVFALGANVISGPVPKLPLEAPSAAFSLKTTAGDLARFMVELASPEHLAPGTAAELVRPQVEISDTDAYGLGIAIYHASGNDWLWHSGDNQAFQSLMAICPATGDGVVLLANGQNGSVLNGRIVRRALGIDFRVER
jgi:CubicO group peptidase (beta-lactamase class C family)